jgi:hypothetical protein
MLRCETAVVGLSRAKPNERDWRFEILGLARLKHDYAEM